MARTITKKIASATIYGLDATKTFDVDENGMPKANVELAVDGNPSQNKARLLLEKHCKTKNVMVLQIEVDETKLNVSPSTFIANSEVCDEGATYSREYVTQTFKITYYDGFYIDEKSGMQTMSGIYTGETTANKLLNYAREIWGSSAVITKTEVVEERRYMKREKYLELAR